MAEENKGNENKGQDKTFTQTDVDTIVQERVARERKKYADYEDLRKFKDSHEQENEAARTKALEEQKKYDELKKGWEDKENKYKAGLAEKEQQINSLKIDHALNAELAKLNAYPDAAAILKPMITLSADGTPQMKGKDQVGNEVAIPIADGIKKFLEERSYLIKANNQPGGGGTPPAGHGGGGGEGEVKLEDLNNQLAKAQATNDYKKAQEIKGKISTYFSSKGISRQI